MLGEQRAQYELDEEYQLLFYWMAKKSLLIVG